jgi:hypothetical protein
VSGLGRSGASSVSFHRRASAIAGSASRLRPAAELVERRGGAKENAELQSTIRTLSRATVSQAQSRIREAVIRNRRDKLTALLHHLTVDVLRASFFGLKKFAVSGDYTSTRAEFVIDCWSKYFGLFQ